MAIDIQKEKLIDGHEYARLKPAGRRGKPMHISTFYRHISQGLEHVKFGGAVYTSMEAVQRFIDQKTAAKNGRPVDPTVSRSRDHERAAREAAALGI